MFTIQFSKNVYVCLWPQGQLKVTRRSFVSDVKWKKWKNKFGPMMPLALIVTNADDFVHIFLVYFRGADFRNQNNCFLYRANFPKSGITVVHLFSLHIAYKWPSCDLQLTLRSYAHIHIFRELNGEHFDIGYLLVWCNLMLKQWSMVYQSEAG